ncbi:hypothetical protein TRFO_13888 [Tritrichomonas foetus]|uniref:Uncharacterized protein n=1 Tax=Tritrichomonas foetus TaxID=1144522 RepID=A0A1J4KWQ5_9EUKA|nr:hypothetical protein TRFO_13888 [Tritrichomonas foetus]|eukprot:OHT15721.1 hypothetical protein TRFO_13888 [Tritrichomonas foetus]
MFFLFLVVPIFSRTFFEPIEGYCDPYSKKVPCSQSCIFQDGDLDCVDKSHQLLCELPQIYFFIVWGCFLLPPVLSLFFSILCCRGTMPPPCTYIINFVFDTIWSLIVTGIYCIATTEKGFEPQFMIMIMVPTIFLLQGTCAFLIGGLPCCRSLKSQPHYIKNLMRQPVFTRNDLEKYIEQIKTGPPVIQLSGTLAIETTINYMHKGHMRSRKGIQKTPFQEVHPYVSWEETADAVRIPEKKSLLIVLTDVKFAFTEELQMYMKTKAEQMVKEASHGGGTATVQPVDYVQGLTVLMIATPHNSKPKIQKFTSSCFGKFLWMFLGIFGQHSVYESIYCAHLGRMKVKSRKSISAQPDYHCPAYQPDPAAPTFKR